MRQRKRNFSLSIQLKRGLWNRKEDSQPVAKELKERASPNLFITGSKDRWEREGRGYDLKENSSVRACEDLKKGDRLDSPERRNKNAVTNVSDEGKGGRRGAIIAPEECPSTKGWGSPRKTRRLKEGRGGEDRSEHPGKKEGIEAWEAL